MADCEQLTRTLTKLPFRQFHRFILSRLTVGAQIRHRNPPFLRLTAQFERSEKPATSRGDRWQHMLTYAAQYRLIRPGCLRHKMQRRLVRRGGSLRRGHRRKWFDAFATLCGQQPDAIVLEWSDAVSMAQHRCQVCRIGAESSFRSSLIVEIHATLPGTCESPLLPNRNRVGPSPNCPDNPAFATQ
jgi:hypothetical protein